MRADQLLVHRGLASTRAQAQRLIASGVQWLKLGHHHTAQGAMSGAEIGAASSSGSTLYWQRIVKNGDILNLPNNELSRPSPRLADGAQMLYDFVFGDAV